MTDQDALKAFRRKASYSNRFNTRRGASKQESNQPMTIKIGRIQVLNPKYKGK